MVNNSIPFAQALLDIGLESGKEDVFYQELKGADALMKETQDLQKVLAHPRVEKEEKQRLLKEIFADSDPTFQDFLSVLNSHRMAGSLCQVYEDYARLLDNARGILNVEVVSASALNDEQKEKLQKALEKKFQAPVRLHIEIDPSLIAGFKIKTDNHTMDVSYRGKLETMKEQLKKS